MQQGVLLLIDNLLKLKVAKGIILSQLKGWDANDQKNSKKEAPTILSSDM